MKTWLVLILISVVAAGVGVVWAVVDEGLGPTVGGPPLRESLLERPAAGPATPGESGQPAVEVDGAAYDFGRMDAKNKGEHSFKLKNVGDALLTLREGGTTCQCAVSELKKVSLYPGESTEVKLTWTAKEFFGPYEQTAKIHTNDPVRPTVILKVTGRITSPLRSAPSEIVFSRLSVGQPAKAEARVFAYSSDSLQIKGHKLLDPETAPLVEVSYAPLGTEEVAAEPDAKSGWRVEVGVKSGLLPGRFEQTIRLETNLANAPTLDIPIRGKVGSDIAVLGRGWNTSAETLALGLVPSAEGTTRQLMLVVRGPFRRHVAFEVAEVSPSDVIEAELGQTTEINQGAALRTPLEVRVRRGTAPCNYLGSTDGKTGYVLLRTTHPHVPELKVPVRFAVEGS